MARATLVCGLGYGDEGKGTTVDFLARQPGARLVVRYNGGAQAAHNVVTDDRHHTFAQFGSGTFSGVPTLLSRHVRVNPLALFSEARHLTEVGVSSPLAMLTVEGGALVTTPFHVAMNRLREMSRTGKHGSCGMGIGETTADALACPTEALCVADLADPRKTRAKLLALRAHKVEELRSLEVPASASARRERGMIEDDATVDACADAYASFVRSVSVVGDDWLGAVLRREGHVIFEGAQGVLLDQDFGFQPYTTWTDITFANAYELLGGFSGAVTRLGVLRSYATRHGAGPFVTEDPSFDPLSAHDHNVAGEWQGNFRSGALDLVATRYALDVVGGIDAVAITNLDRLALLARPSVCIAYESANDPSFFDQSDRIRVRRPFDLGHQEALADAMASARPIYEPLERQGYAEAIAARLGVRLALASFGPRASDKVANKMM